MSSHPPSAQDPPGSVAKAPLEAGGPVEPAAMTRGSRPVSTRWALTGLAIAMLLASLGTSIANIALPSLERAFGASFQQVQWVVLAYLLAVTVVIVSAGRLGDLLGRRRLLLVGLVVFTTASALCGVAPGLWFLIAARTVQGLGAAVLMALTIGIVRDTVPTERTGSAMGLMGTMSAIGTALGPSLGGVLLAGPGWRSVFLLMVPLGAGGALIAQRHLPAGPAGAGLERRGFDGAGTLLLALALTAFALAATIGSGHPQRANLVLLAIAVLSLAMFGRAEAKAESPLVPPGTLRSTSLKHSLVMNAIVATVMMATLVVGPFYLSRALGLNAAVVGIVMAVGPIISALTGVPAGRIVDRRGARPVVTMGLASMAVGSIALASLPPIIGVVGYIAALALLTPGYQLFQAANNTVVMMGVKADRRGVVSGILSLSRNLGLITGAAVLGMVFAVGAGATNVTAATPGAVTEGMELTFGLAALLVVVALALSLVRTTDP